MRSYPRHAAPRRGLLSRCVDALFPHTVAYLDQAVSVHNPWPISHVRVTDAADIAALSVIDAQQEERRHGAA